MSNQENPTFLIAALKAFNVVNKAVSFCDSEFWFVAVE